MPERSGWCGVDRRWATEMAFPSFPTKSARTTVQAFLIFPIKGRPDRAVRSGRKRSAPDRRLHVVTPVELEPLGGGHGIQFIDNGLEAGREIGLAVLERIDVSCDFIKRPVSGLES